MSTARIAIYVFQIIAILALSGMVLWAFFFGNKWELVPTAALIVIFLAIRQWVDTLNADIWKEKP